MAEYIEKELVLAFCDDEREEGGSDIRAIINRVRKAKAADVAPVPQEYAYFTTMDDENYLVDLTIPVSKSQYDAINSGKDLWSVLRMDGE